MGVKIDKGTPLPTTKQSGHQAGGLPYEQLEVGDFSFIYPAKPGESATKTQKRAAVTNRYHSKRLGRKFVTRIVEERGERIVRIWRVA